MSEMYMDRIPEGILTQKDIEVIKKSGWGKRRGFGQKPAVLVIDAQYTFVGTREDTLASIETGNPMGIGGEAWLAVDKIAELIALARQRNIPVVYCRVTRGEGEKPYNWGMFKRFKTNMPELDGVNGTDIVKELAPLPNEIVLEKQFPSAFYGTPLHSYLTTMGIDTLLITGFVTSGCVRATVNDSCQNGFRTIIVEDGVADRFILPHMMELLTMDLKYGDVVPLTEVKAYMGTL